MTAIKRCAIIAFGGYEKNSLRGGEGEQNTSPRFAQKYPLDNSNNKI
ncbi:hypothetical protein BH10BAC3_BH10BAC3_39840 [soil metagenome]